MIGFEDYSKVFNNYCICYFGFNNDYLIELELLRPKLEQEFPDLNIYLSCKDDCINILQKNDKNITLSDLKIKRSQFVHINELKFDGINHPVEKFVEDSGVSNLEISITPKDSTTRCLILTEGFYPTKNLTTDQINKISIFAEKSGYYVEINKEIRGAGLVIGVENPNLFKAASQGIKTMLVPTGVGTHLYKKMFPFNKIF